MPKDDDLFWSRNQEHDRRVKLVRKVQSEHPDWGTRRIAHATKIHKSSVQRIRKELESGFSADEQIKTDIQTEPGFFESLANDLDAKVTELEQANAELQAKLEKSRQIWIEQNKRIKELEAQLTGQSQQGGTVQPEPVKPLDTTEPAWKSAIRSCQTEADLEAMAGNASSWSSPGADRSEFSKAIRQRATEIRAGRLWLYVKHGANIAAHSGISMVPAVCLDSASSISLSGCVRLLSVSIRLRRLVGLAAKKIPAGYVLSI